MKTQKASDSFVWEGFIAFIGERRGEERRGEERRGEERRGEERRGEERRGHKVSEWTPNPAPIWQPSLVRVDYR